MSRASGTGTRGAQRRPVRRHTLMTRTDFLMTPSYVASRRPILTKLCGFAFWCGASKSRRASHLQSVSELCCVCVCVTGLRGRRTADRGRAQARVHSKITVNVTVDVTGVCSP
eukprot:4960175-Prymnesium_polylepis.1